MLFLFFGVKVRIQTAAKQLETAVTEVGCKSFVVRIGFANDMLLHFTLFRVLFVV